MLKIGFTNESDTNEALKLQNREKYEEERKKRIFNAKQRLFGLDLDTLERQIAEKKQKRLQEEEWNKRFEVQEENQKRIIRAKEKELEKERRLQEADLLYYRCKFQRKDQRREFDLNDPNYLKNSKPMRLADDDLTLGLSSAQVFSGEDLYNKERKLRQCQQQRAWLDQQVLERKQFEEAHLKAERMWIDSVSSRDKLLEDMARDGHKVRNQIIDKTRQYNLEMARQKRLEQERKKRECHEDDMAEIYNMLTSDMLSEKRKNNDVSSSEYTNLRKVQAEQLKEAQQRKDNEVLIDKQWEQFAINTDRQLMLKQIEMDRQRREQHDEFIRENEKLAVQQKLQQKQANEFLMNSISDEFYEQFNKNSR